MIEVSEQRRKSITLFVTILALGITILDSTVVNVALPEIERDLDMGLSGQQWVVDGYLLTLGALILTGGSAGDVFGQRRVFMAGLAGFGLASLACGLAQTEVQLIIARLVQGIGGALLVPGTLAILVSTFEGEERATAIGRWAGFGGVAAAVGPLAGGLLLELLSWPFVFLVNLPVIALALVLTAIAVPRRCDERVGERRLDAVGSVLASAGLGGVVLALIEGPAGGWARPLVIGSLVVGVAALGAFAAWERRTRDPMLPLALFRVPNFAAANLATLAVYAALTGNFFFLVIYLQSVVGYSPLAAGAALLPVTALMLALSPLAGRVAERSGPRLPMTVGPLVAAAGILLFVGLERGDSYMTAVFPGAVVFGLGLALTVAPLTSAVMASVEPASTGIASAVNNAVARTGGLLAVAALGLVVGAEGLTSDSFRAIVVICAALCIAGGLVSAAGVRRLEPLAKSA